MTLPRRVLFVGAHCDDVELFAGGLLARACEERCEVGVLVFSDHRGVLEGALAAQSREEMRSNLAWLSEQTGTRIVDHSGAMLAACDGSFVARRAEIYGAMERLRDGYDLVVTHAPSDTNQDHQQVAAEAQRALKAHATVLGGEFPNNDLGTFRATYYVALSPFAIDAKARMIEAYASQRRDGRPYVDGAVARALAKVRGSQIRSEAAEAFEIVGRVIAR
ncbi:PIG-L deacetylase family protein [Sandaracinus amylolyticus]|uniref:PIG-L deacetylase family protein n=1 Tax=Sandaracinus amylolyticus TaxID=927083 RepID=UPI001F1CAA93|nr:PIG-L family deacetylase [Sandaracinus amylolyticus]UJR84392.1 Hypothetical protein I5071_64710 [Sandaracinus amylolyticus]